MAHLIAKGTSREAEATSRELGRLPYSRSSFERVGATGAAADLGHEVGTEEALIREYAVPAETSLTPPHPA